MPEDVERCMSDASVARRWTTIVGVPSRQARAAVRIALTIAAALLLSRVWFLAHRAIDLDEYEHGHAAWSVARGLIPYRDFFEHHPPALYLLSAPLFAAPATATDAAAAAGALMRARAAMWLMTFAAVGIVYRLGLLLRDRRDGAIHLQADRCRARRGGDVNESDRDGRLGAAFAVALLLGSSQFVESMLEFRPDVPAVLCLLLTIWCVVGAAGGRDDSRSRARLLAGGVAYGAALLFTQKVLFAAPGLGVALLLRRRVAPPILVAIGAMLPIVATAWWFSGHGALAPLAYYTITFNRHLNADGFSPFPRLLSNIVQQPALYVLGVAGIVTSVRVRPTRFRVRRRAKPLRRAAVARLTPSRDIEFETGFSRTVILSTSVSLIAGIFIIGRSYDQYYALLLPLLAVLGGSCAADRFDAAPPRRSLVAGAALVAVAVWCLAVSARRFEPIEPQLEEIAFVLQRTAPADAYFGASPGAALFRPHAWYFFFMTARFASDRDFADVLHAFETGRLRPPLVVRNRLEEQMPPSLVAYIDGHYRPAHGGVYLRQSEYGNASLNTSDASDRFDRPFTR
ncbi:MAG TPA: glycosyltransferase family 39 protein [Vicinamibacterales bacterium]|nr:glycosyltransferase family 39 protein [Vicinamibacterales bacterium]